ncbi:UNVERIFIED_CONTAM: hypothetical protein Sindi_0855600 [Sesamum indicum]
MTQKGYKVYDLEDHILFTSRDVIFHELIFPFAQVQSIERFECPFPTPSMDTDDSHTESVTMPSPSYVASPETIPLVQHTNVATSSQQPTQRSTRVSQKPLWLHDFMCRQGRNVAALELELASTGEIPTRTRHKRPLCRHNWQVKAWPPAPGENKINCPLSVRSKVMKQKGTEIDNVSTVQYVTHKKNIAITGIR